MKKNNLFALVLVALTPLLSRCVASDTDAHNVDLRMRTLDNRMVELERSINQNQNKRGGSRSAADTSEQIDRLNAEILKLKGQMEESSHRSKASGGTGSSDQMQSMKAELEQLRAEIAALKDQEFRAASDDATRAAQEARNKAAQTAVPIITPTETKIPVKPEEKKPEQPVTVPKEITKETIKEQPTKEPPKVVATPTPPPTDNKKDNDQGGRDLYENGISLYKKNSYAEAQASFSEYLSKHPKGEMAPNARFWMGDCHFSEGNYEYAILEYDRVVKDYGSHEKAPAALLKQGMAFEKLKDDKTAKIIYEKLMKTYPKSEQVEKAKARIDALKK